MLCEDLKNNDIKYLLTSFLTTDALENFFSVIRSRGGYYAMPSVRQFRIAMQQNMASNGNCEDCGTKDLDLEDIDSKNTSNSN